MYSLDDAIAGLACAHGGPPVRGHLRSLAEDFQVTELPLVEPTGEGEHVWLLIRKRGLNTVAVAGRLAQFAGVSPRNVSFAGMKDRHALTEQWFSVHLPGREEPDWPALDSEDLTCVRHVRHARKLRRGALRGNAFSIRVRDTDGDTDLLMTRLQQVARAGVPGYFGEQRFGRGGSNLDTADRLFAGTGRRLSRQQRGLALSAARAFLFNRVLAQRVAAGSWNQLLPGEAVQLSGSHSFFIAEVIDADLQRRLQTHDINPTGPMHGKGESRVVADCRQLEADCLAPFTDWQQGLEAAGLKQERRALRVVPANMTWSWPEQSALQLEFSLPAGCYATSVLRELVDYRTD